MTSLAQWASAFRDLDGVCPWPGPRPLDHERPEDHLLLVGRAPDEESFSDDVLSHRLVVLTADTGVGKSSLLEIGLTRSLEAEGFVPLICRTWTNFAAGDDAEHFLLRNLRTRLPAGIVADGTTSLCSQLDRRYGESAVLILDQFEELIRYRPRLFQEMLQWLAMINHRHETHVVLSLRSEYTHRLRWLESQVRPFSMATYVLEPLRGGEVIEEVARSGNLTHPGAITDAATTQVGIMWAHAASEYSADPDDLGVLHLQSALYALHARAGGSVDVEHVQAMRNDAKNLRLSVHELAAREAVRLKLERCRDACRHPSLPEPLDQVLIEGTMGMVQRVSGQLSSGGYKLVREEWELASKTLAGEIERLGVRRGVRHTAKLYHRLVEPGDERAELLTLQVADLDPENAPPEGRTSPQLEAIGIVTAPWVADPDDLSSGPMFGMAPSAILVEELRRFAFALQWLRLSSILRSSSPTPGQTMLSLIHDGFGAALNAWAEDHRAGPARAIHLLTAAHGERFDWQYDRGDRPAHREFDGRDEVVTITNVRWRDCLVSATFRRVVFVNCDFRGTRFERCGFRGVVFVNCLLDGATFGECKIYGMVRDTIDTPSPLPDFRVEVPASTVAVIARYRGLPKQTASALYSKTSGVPAVPWRADLGPGIPWAPQDGGLTMYGGRLSSLMIRNCDFDDGGMIAFRSIAGSSLDVVEQRGGVFEIYDSAIRGLTVTRSVEEADPDRGALVETPRLDISVRSTLIGNTWFGPELRGKASFSDCLVWQLLNLSDRKSFDVELDRCGFVGVSNVHPPDATSGRREEFETSDIRGRDDIVRLALRMDYRSTPARLELDPTSATDNSADSSG